jgi:hypothetical protein
MTVTIIIVFHTVYAISAVATAVAAAATATAATAVVAAVAAVMSLLISVTCFPLLHQQSRQIHYIPHFLSYLILIYLLSVDFKTLSFSRTDHASLFDANQSFIYHVVQHTNSLIQPDQLFPYSTSTTSVKIKLRKYFVFTDWYGL